MKTLFRRFSVLFVVAALASFVLVAVGTSPASACGPLDPPSCSEKPTTDSGDNGVESTGTKTASYVTPARSCSVYANGGGMGMYCLALGAGNAKSLRERFGSQKLQKCRYSNIPEGIKTPFNASPGDGRFMMMSCLGNIDFDTFNGGTDRTLDVSMVFVPNGTDVADRHNGITDFLFDQFDSSTQMPVPFMVTRPNVTPLVGVPTFFTFRWVDPATKRTVDGPVRQIRTNGVVMRAEATRVRVDPNQDGMKAVVCDPNTPYRDGVSARYQPAKACSITFDRSSASARKYASEPIPANVKDAFYASVEVTWKVTYGNGTVMNTLGDGFTMRMKQVLPVQEVQAPNQPPSVIY